MGVRDRWWTFLGPADGKQDQCPPLHLGLWDEEEERAELHCLLGQLLGLPRSTADPRHLGGQTEAYRQSSFSGYRDPHLH